MMAEDTERPMSSSEMIRRAREDLAAKKPDVTGSTPPVAMPDLSDTPQAVSSQGDKTWRNPVPAPMPPSRADRRAREKAYAETPAPAPPTQAPSAARAAALVAGILVALVGFGVALAVALANGGG